MSNENDILLEELANRDYESGFVTDIDMEVAPLGLSEDTVRFISAKKGEPSWLLDWWLNVYNAFLRSPMPSWQNFILPSIDFQEASYYAPPRQKANYQSLDEVDPELLATFEKLGIPLTEQKMLSGLAGD